MRLVKKAERAQNTNIHLSGSSTISKLVVILSSLCNGISNITNISKGEEVNNLINILHQFGINIINSDKTTIISGKNITQWQQPENIINVNTSFDILSYILNIIYSNNIRAFFTGNDNFIKQNFTELQYLDGNNLFFKNKYKLPLMVNNNTMLLKNSLSAENTIKKNSLLFNFFSNNRDCEILDKETKEEYLEQILKYYGVEIKETVIEHKNIFTRHNRKSKEIIVKNSNNSICGKNFTVPADINEAIYTIFIGLLLDMEEFYIENVSLNDLNYEITRILVENGVNLEFRNQRILNGIKVADFIVKKSTLKPLTISKNRLQDIIDLYPMLIILNIIKQNEITFTGIKELKNIDKDNYNSLISILQNINVSFVENKDILEIKYNNIQIHNNDITLDNLDNIDTKITLPLFLSNVALQHNIFIKNNMEDIAVIFPNMINVLEQFNIEIVYDN